MIITCPNCNKQFKIDNSLIPDEGRDLQCGSCESIWFYKPKNESEAPLTLNENISKNKIEPAIETNDKKLEFVISSSHTNFTHTEMNVPGRKIKFIRKLNNVR